MDRPRILLGITGSVAAVLAEKIVNSLMVVGDVKVVMTEAACRFYDPDELTEKTGVTVFLERHEWWFSEDNTVYDWQVEDERGRRTPQESSKPRRWRKGDPVLHIELRKWADIMVIAPLTANTLAKMAVGSCDNLLTSIFRAWDMTKPIVVAPAMNTFMWNSELTYEHLSRFSCLLDIFDETPDGFGDIPIVNNMFIAQPETKLLACGDEGDGAMAHTDDIANETHEALRWVFPLIWEQCSGIPVGNHPGAFSFVRHTAHHTGVDLYTTEGAKVRAIEGGVVVGVQCFTGAKVDKPWWNDTEAVLIEGRSGVINYGEIIPEGMYIGLRVKRGDIIGTVTPVVKEGKERPDVPGHSRSMLHLELYPHGHDRWLPWPIDQEEHQQLDPTQLLIGSLGAPEILPEFEGKL